MDANVRAPGLSAGLGWLNIDRPLDLHKDLAGHVVVLDFWTYCCINCIHILPDLAYLEHKYAAEPVVFIGVHSAKFPNEADAQTIRAAIHRYEIAHPVVIDDDMSLWRSYTVRSWPTVVVIDPRGYVAASLAGEGQREAMDRVIGDLLGHHRAAGTLARERIHIQKEGTVRAASGLAFPGKVLADADGGRLYISDSNHNRIVVTTWPDEQGGAELVQVVGTGQAGAQDGPADGATFHHPQGMALGRDKLYVADTENHLIRVVDVKSWSVTTAVGTGKMTYDWSGGGRGVKQGINSPWDIAIEGSTLYVAMAGQHQIWRIDMPAGFARALAGSGRENIVDGPNETAALAQPSGICIHQGRIYFADSEVSAIRMIDMGSERVSTLIGAGLFHFGDADGAFEDSLLQHPLGIASWHDKLWVADTYNHKIKEIDPAGRMVRTRFGDGRPGAGVVGGAVQFFEPGGLSVGRDRVFVADTNNHRIVMIEPVSGRWTELAIAGLSAPHVGAGPHEVAAPAVDVVADLGQGCELIIDGPLPAGTKLSPDAPWQVRIEAGGGVIVQATGRSERWPIRCAVAPGVQPGHWRAMVSFACCTDGAAAMCLPVHRAWQVNVVDDRRADRFIRLRIEP